jgi:uncharacterized protein (TIGR01777 family)
MTASTIVIAGGTGFIGRRLSAVLAGAGHDIVILSRSTPRPSVGPVQFVQWQTTDRSWSDHLEGAKAVINLCGESIGGPRWSDSRKAKLIGSRVEPTQDLVAAVNACRTPPSLFIQASGVGYYGAGSEVCTEAHAQGDDFLADLAGLWEAPLDALTETVKPIILRLGVVLGKTGGALQQMLTPFRYFVGGPIASGNQWLSWIHLHDACAAITMLISAEDSFGASFEDRSGIYNLTAPNPVRNAEFAKAAGQALGRPSWMFTPRFVLKALLGEQATLICDGQQAIPERLQTSGFSFSYPDIQAATRDLA